MEKLTGSDKTERMLYKNSDITKNEEIHWQEYLLRLMKHEPVQYVLHEAWFYGLKFYVDEHVLIPRAETEELVDWIVRDAATLLRPEGGPLRILDIGTGSGCIPIAIRKKLAGAEVTSCDVSEAALEVARRNAQAHGVKIEFRLADILDPIARESLTRYDIIVSNPPYVPLKDKRQMAKHVMDYEPHLALFVPDEDPLIFYRAIAGFGIQHLLPRGSIYVEIHEELSGPVTELFRQAGYTTEKKSDMQGKERMVKAYRPLQ
jgi:release factor glutamine methyltransferase